MLWAIIPVKPLRESKSRLSGVLSPDERAELTRFVLQRTLRILRQVEAVDQIMVVSRDPGLLKMARQTGAMTLVEGSRPGLNVALTRAAYVAAAQRATSLLILPSDLPLLTVADVQMMLTGANPANGLRPGNGYYQEHTNGHTHLNGYHNGHSPKGNGIIRPSSSGQSNGNQATNGQQQTAAATMTICPDHHEDGTNALYIRPATGFTFYYGVGSFHKHLQEAARLGMFYRIIHAPGIKFDLDTESDWQTYQTVFYREKATQPS